MCKMAIFCQVQNIAWSHVLQCTGTCMHMYMYMYTVHVHITCVVHVYASMLCIMYKMYRRVRIISSPSILFAPTQTKTFPSGMFL